jgi:hypothetical protein
MGEVNKILIQQSTFAPDVVVEECERVEGEYLLRFARVKDVGVGERISRFIDDLFTGTKKAKGCLCDRQNLPAHVYIGGRRLVVSGTTAHPAGADQKKLDIAFCVPGTVHSEKPNAKRSHNPLDAEIDLDKNKSALLDASGDTSSASAAQAKTVRTRMAQDLAGQFAANGLARKDSGLRAFLACSGHTRTLRPQHAIQLMMFADKFGQLESELHQDVARAVRAELQKLQQRIRHDLRSVNNSTWSNFTFLVLGAQSALAAPQSAVPPHNPSPASPPSSPGNVPLAAPPNNLPGLILQAPPPVPSINTRPALSTNSAQENLEPERLARAPSPIHILDDEPALASTQDGLPNENSVSSGGQGSFAEELVAGHQKLRPAQLEAQRMPSTRQTPSNETLVMAARKLKPVTPQVRKKIEPEVSSDPVATALVAGLAKMGKGLQDNDNVTSDEIDEWADPPPADLPGRENTT